jgi:hypothetical protein
MALRIETLKLKVNYLVLIGKYKDYVVPFDTGLNIIYGDTDTGKSSILNLIDYCLGSKSIDYYDEIIHRGKYCLLEVELKGVVYTIKRDIFNSKDYVEVYPSKYQDIDNAFPKYYSPPSSTQTAPDGLFSTFLLESMNLPVTKIKEAPSKEISKIVALSFRDIFKYCYLDQDKIGSKKIFGDNWPLITKLKETFKFMYNVLDNQIQELEARISEMVIEKNALVSKNTSVASFLKETEVDSLNDLKDKKESLENELDEVLKFIKEIDETIVHGSPELNSLRITVNGEEKRIRDLQEKLDTREQEIKQNIALRNEYTNDIRKMNAAIEVISKFPKMEDKKLDCPVCDTVVPVNKLKEHFIDSSPQSIKGELNALRRRLRDLITIYEGLKSEQLSNEEELKKKMAYLDEIKTLLDKQTVEIVSPYLSKRDAYSYRAGTLKSDIKNIQHFYKIRLQQSINDAEIVEIDRNLKELRESLTRLKDNAPSLEGIFAELGQTLSVILNYVKIKNATNISISRKTYLPIIRNRDYENITSGGVRTISSFAYFLSLMIYAIEHPVNYPSFLMVDTIAKYLGKTKEKDLVETNLNEDIQEGMTDGRKYENIYRYLLTLEKFKNSFQLIIVDNDIPEGLTVELQPYIRKHFAVNTAGAEIGFIDDIQLGEKMEQLPLFDNENDDIKEDVDFDDDITEL